MSQPRCPLCRQRTAKRACPALAERICAVCCGTKRHVEIRCPDDCAYLIGARAHPAAVVRRRQSRDLRFLAALLQDLSDEQVKLLSMVQEFVRAYRAEAVPALSDGVVADAAAALAATFETATRGIIYEHAASSVPAEHLAAALKGLLEGARGATRFESDAMVVFRRIERAAREAARAFGEGEAAYLDFLARLHAEARTAARSPAGGGRIILPPGALRR